MRTRKDPLLLKLNVTYEFPKSKYKIREINGIEYICQIFEVKYYQERLELRNQISLALQDFIKIDIQDNTSILSYCNEYGVLFSSQHYHDYLLSINDFIPFHKSFKKELVPENMNTTMPLCLFKYYYYLIYNSYKLNENSKKYKKLFAGKGLNRDLIHDLLYAFLEVALQPKIVNIPKIYTHHPLSPYLHTRLSHHFSDFIDIFCPNNPESNLNAFFEFSLDNLTTNAKRIEYTKTGKMSGSILRKTYAPEKYIDYEYLDTSLRNEPDENNSLKEIFGSKTFTYDLQSPLYKKLFKDVFPSLIKDFGLVISNNGNIMIDVPNNLSKEHFAFLDFIADESNLFIIRALNTQTDQLHFTGINNLKQSGIYYNSLSIKIDTLLQFICLNLIDVLHITEIRYCKYSKCQKPFLAYLDENTKRSRCCCDSHYENYRKSDYRNKHSKT